MIQAHPSLFMRQVHNYQKVGKAGVVITGEGQSSCWTCRGPRGLLLQKKKQPPKKSSDLDVWVNHRAVKLALSTLPTLINWHLPAANPPPPVLLASHMLYDKKIRPLNEWRHGGLVNRPCDDGDTVRGGRFTRLPSKRRSEAWKLGPRGGGRRRQETFFLFFAQGSAGNSTHLTRFLQSRRICFSLTDLHVNEEKLIPSKLLLF